nr:MAG TPA: Protein of unknown function (DUF3309) [Caudoviricetes sp.]
MWGRGWGFPGCAPSGVWGLLFLECDVLWRQG